MRSMTSSAGLIGDIHQSFRNAIIDLISEGDPRAEAQFRDGQSSFSESAVFHDRESKGLEVHLYLDADQSPFLGVGLFGIIQEFSVRCGVHGG